MARKKAVKKRTTSKKKVSKKKVARKAVSRKDAHIEKALIDNFVSLQKVLTNMSIKFDLLTNQISELLNLFEESARTLARKDLIEIEEKNKNKKILETMNSILNQNKLIAKGLTLMHDSAKDPGVDYVIGSSPELKSLKVREEEPENIKKEPDFSSFSQGGLSKRP